LRGFSYGELQSAAFAKRQTDQANPACKQPLASCKHRGLRGCTTAAVSLLSGRTRALSRAKAHHARVLSVEAAGVIERRSKACRNDSRNDQLTQISERHLK